MILELPELLDGAELNELREIAAGAKFLDGRLTNSGFDQKANLQIDQSQGDHARSSMIVMGALLRSHEFREFTLPRRIAPPLMAKYEPGMKYGAHADAAFLPIGGEFLRSDVSCTVFINDPGLYDGGELVIHIGDHPAAIKLPAGSAILYPSTTLHEVTPVRRGVRLVAITFVESRVVGEQERWILFELGDISSLEGSHMDAANRMRLEVIRHNLTRRWSR